jgi:hypothetical protein
MMGWTRYNLAMEVALMSHDHLDEGEYAERSRRYLEDELERLREERLTLQTALTRIAASVSSSGRECRDIALDALEEL